MLAQASSLNILDARISDAEVLASTIDLGQRVLAVTPLDHSEWARRAGNQANRLQLSFERVRAEPAVLADAIALGGRALAVTLDMHPDWAMYASNHAGRLLDQDEHENLALRSVLLTTFQCYLPWVAASSLDEPVHLPPYMNGLVDQFGQLNAAALRARIAQW